MVMRKLRNRIDIYEDYISPEQPWQARDCCLSRSKDMKLRTTILFLVVCLALAGCLANKSADTKPPIEYNGNQNPYVIARETEYAVYRALIEEMYVDDVKLIVISSETEQEFHRDSLNELPEIHADTRDSFMNRNQQSELIDCTKLELSVPCMLFDEEEFEEVVVSFHKNPTPTQMWENFKLMWDRFDKKYPGSRGFIWLSRIGLNTERSQALVSAGQLHRVFDGTAYLALLVRKDDAWVIHSALAETTLGETKVHRF